MEITREFNQLRIGVIGLGFVGLPVALLFRNKGFRVIGIDIDSRKIDKINQNISYLLDIEDKDIEAALLSGNFSATTDYNVITELDSIIICVPTPLKSNNTPDLSYIRNVAEELAKRMKKGQLVILESSTLPGTTEEILLPILEKNGYKVGKDFYLAYSPERLDPGNKLYSLESIPKLISGVTKECMKQIRSLYSKVFEETVEVSSPEVAEITKLFENTFRFINISFINEFSMICDKLNINIWDVINAAKTKPYGFMPFYPGPGIGGHCIPVDPIYLDWRAKQFGADFQFIDLANKVNEFIPIYIINQLKMILESHMQLEQAKILLCGVSYKKDVGDVRESPALFIFRDLLRLGSSVSYFDPYVPEIMIDGNEYKSINVEEEVLERFDCVVILTDHSNLPLQEIITNETIVYDTRNVINGVEGNREVFHFGGGKK